MTNKLGESLERMRRRLPSSSSLPLDVLEILEGEERDGSEANDEDEEDEHELVAVLHVGLGRQAPVVPHRHLVKGRVAEVLEHPLPALHVLHLLRFVCHYAAPGTVRQEGRLSEGGRGEARRVAQDVLTRVLPLQHAAHAAVELAGDDGLEAVAGGERVVEDLPGVGDDGHGHEEAAEEHHDPDGWPRNERRRLRVGKQRSEHLAPEAEAGGEEEEGHAVERDVVGAGPEPCEGIEDDGVEKDDGDEPGDLGDGQPEEEAEGAVHARSQLLVHDELRVADDRDRHACLDGAGEEDAGEEDAVEGLEVCLGRDLAEVEVGDVEREEEGDDGDDEDPVEVVPDCPPVARDPAPGRVVELLRHRRGKPVLELDLLPQHQVVDPLQNLLLHRRLLVVRSKVDLLVRSVVVDPRPDHVQHVLGGVVSRLALGRRNPLEVADHVARRVVGMPVQPVGFVWPHVAVVDDPAALLEEEEVVEHGEDLARRLVDGADDSPACCCDAADHADDNSSGPGVEA
eukprot:764363-Hanusia_phi.AAC.6